MTTTEIVLNMLAETSITDISKQVKPQTFSENKNVAKQGGEVAGIARKALEDRTGHPVVSSLNAIEFQNLMINMINNISNLGDEEDN